MASTPTTRNRLNLQGTGDNVGAWGAVLNTNVFALVDEALDGLTTITLTGNVTLSSANYATDQSRKRILRLTGTPGTTYTVTVPSVEKFYLVHNTTTNPQQIQAAGGLPATVPASTFTYVYCDGTDSFAPTATVNLAIGMMTDFAGLAAPAGWLLCGGQAVNRVIYSALFQVIGTNYGVGDGSTTFNVPDMRGRTGFGKDDMASGAASRITSGTSGITGTTLGAAGGDQRRPAHNHTISISDPTHAHVKTESPHSHGITDPGHVHGTTDPQHNHGVSDPTHTHTFVDTYPGGGGALAAGSGYQPLTQTVSTAAAATGISIQNNATGISINSAITNISTQGTTTGISYAAAATGITASIGTSGAGGSENMPPALIVNKIIYTGV